MKKLILICIIAMLAACNNSKPKETKQQTPAPAPQKVEQKQNSKQHPAYKGKSVTAEFTRAEKDSLIKIDSLYTTIFLEMQLRNEKLDPYTAGKFSKLTLQRYYEYKKTFADTAYISQIARRASESWQHDTDSLRHRSDSLAALYKPRIDSAKASYDALVAATVNPDEVCKVTLLSVEDGPDSLMLTFQLQPLRDSIQKGEFRLMLEEPNSGWYSYQLYHKFTAADLAPKTTTIPGLGGLKGYTLERIKKAFDIHYEIQHVTVNGKTYTRDKFLQVTQGAEERSLSDFIEGLTHSREEASNSPQTYFLRYLDSAKRKADYLAQRYEDLR